MAKPWRPRARCQRIPVGRQETLCLGLGAQRTDDAGLGFDDGGRPAALNHDILAPAGLRQHAAVNEDDLSPVHHAADAAVHLPAVKRRPLGFAVSHCERKGGGPTIDSQVMLV